MFSEERLVIQIMYGIWMLHAELTGQGNLFVFLLCFFFFQVFFAQGNLHSPAFIIYKQHQKIRSGVQDMVLFHRVPYTGSISGARTHSMCQGLMGRTMQRPYLSCFGKACRSIPSLKLMLMATLVCCSIILLYDYL